MSNRIARRLGSATAIVCLAGALAAAPAVLAAGPAAAQAPAGSELENVATGLCLENTLKGLPVDGQTVTVAPCTGAAQEQWIVSTYVPGFPVDTIEYDSSASTCLGLYDAQAPAPTVVACGNLYDDGWITEPAGTGAFSYEDIERGACLNATTTAVTFQGCVAGDPNQAWTTVAS